MSNDTTRVRDVRKLLSDADTAYKLVIRGERVSGQAVAALLKRREDLTRELHDLLERERLAAEEAAPLTEDELVEQAIADLAALPDPLLDRVLSGLAMSGRGAALRRCAPPALRVV